MSGGISWFTHGETERERNAKRTWRKQNVERKAQVVTRGKGYNEVGSVQCAGAENQTLPSYFVDSSVVVVVVVSL